MNVEQRVAQARADISDVEWQRAEGELDDETASILIARYEEEIAVLQDTDPEELASPVGRRVVGTVLLGGALLVVALLAANATEPRDGGFITGDAVSVDLDTVTNDQMEAVIAANANLPEVAAMRVALADRYFDEGEFSSALPHYLEALNGQLDSVRRARSLARIGWMSFVSGRSDLATTYLTESLTTDPEYQEARLFLGLVYLETCELQRSIDELSVLAGDPSVPEEIRSDIATALDRANDLSSSGACP